MDQRILLLLLLGLCLLVTEVSGGCRYDKAADMCCDNGQYSVEICIHLNGGNSGMDT